VAAGGLAKKLTVEGGVANKARALYAALFTAGSAAAVDAEDGGDSPRSNGDASNGNGVSNAAGGGAKLGPSIGVAKELLGQLAHDAPGQLAQLVALEWLLAVSAGGGVD
jgi:hypothetical protein